MTGPAARAGRAIPTCGAQSEPPPRDHGALAGSARRIFGAALLSLGLALPAGAELFVCAGDSVRVFADAVSGPFAPLRTISGPATGLTECYSVAVDVLHGELWVPTGPFVRVFGWRADGDAAPLRSIGGASGRPVSAAGRSRVPAPRRRRRRRRA